ncbi:MAG TPA: ABC transporter ATP-binding protein [Bacteroidales bacterium]|nr:ABC transporter ATP-binding protein [Bacteroidales bacterium]
MKSFLRIMAYGKPYGKYWPGYLLISVLGVLFGIANYALIAPLLTVLFQPDTLDAVPVYPEQGFSFARILDMFRYYLVRIKVDEGVMMALVYVAVCLITASLLSNLMQYASQRILVTVRTNLMKNLRDHLFHEITRKPLGFFHRCRKGDILSVVSNDVNEVQHSVASSFHIIFRDPLLVVGFLIVLFYMSPRLTLVALVTLPVSVLLIGRITRALRSGAQISQGLLGRLLSHFEEAVSGTRIIQAFDARTYVGDRFQQANEQHRKEVRKLYNRQELASPLSEFLGVAIAACILFYGGWLQLNGELGMDWPVFIVYIGFYWRVLEPSKSITKAYASIRKGMVSAERIFNILDAPEVIEEDPAALPLVAFTEGIEYRNVSFKYNEEGPYVLKDINLKIPKGKVIALAGPSGAGKTTLADLLPRFYDVEQGEILLDGVNIKQYKKKDLVSRMGIVTQEAILFNDTVANNITFGLKDVPHAEIEQAAKVANAHDFIMELENGYDTGIGDRGERLSGGQRQRLAIARAVLRNPSILILDEATSALDMESEKMVQEALARLMKDRTTVVIAHRLSTIRNADEIVVLNRGRIVERGTHSRLMATGGMYCHLINNNYESGNVEQEVPE